MPVSLPVVKKVEVEKNELLVVKNNENKEKVQERGDKKYNPKKAISEQLSNTCSMDAILGTTMNKSGGIYIDEKKDINYEEQDQQFLSSVSARSKATDVIKINDTHSDKVLLQLALTQCRDRCEPAICCFTPVASLSCARVYQSFCEEYAVCQDVFILILEEQKQHKQQAP